MSAPTAPAAPEKPIVDALREILTRNPWKVNFMRRVQKLIEQNREQQNKTPGYREKGSGGSVSSVSRAQTYARIVADLLRAAVSPAGPAIIHGSVALTYVLEADRSKLSDMVTKNQTEFFNVQQVPFVNLDHNVTIRAYQGWQDTRYSRAIEREMSAEARKSLSVAPNGETEMNKRAKGLNRSLHRVKLRRALRANCLTTLRVTFAPQMAADAREIYGSDVVVLSVLTYRKMPADIQALVNDRKLSEQQIIDIVMQGRRRYEAYFASDEGIRNCERRMRTVPASTTYSYFDQLSYFERYVLPRMRAAVDGGLSGAEAVRTVFPIAADGDENQCQRAFGTWFLNEFVKMFGKEFANEYKYRIIGHGTEEAVRRLFLELLESVESLLADFDKVLLEAFGENHAPVRKRERVAEADAKGSKLLLTASSLPPAKRQKRTPKKKKAASDDTDDEVSDDAATKPTPVIPPPPPRIPPPPQPKEPSLGEYLSPGEKRTREQVLHEMEDAQRNPNAAPSGLPTKNASIWFAPFPPTIAATPVVKSRCQVDAAAAIAERLGVCKELERKNLRRTKLEVTVGDHLIQSATNATTAAVRDAIRNATSPDEISNTRDVGVDSRRILNAAATKPIPLATVIQHANPVNGAVSIVETAEREYAHYRIGTYDVEETFLGDLDKLRAAKWSSEDPRDRIRFVRSLAQMHVALAARINRSLQMCRIPARADSETSHALVRSSMVQDACVATVEAAVELFLCGRR